MFMSRFVNFFRSLMRDTGGASIVFVAASIVPLMAFIGLGTDAARGYLVKARLSQALDAAGLAGAQNAYDPPVMNQDIQMFFAANFPSGFMDSTLTGPTYNYDEPNNKLTVTASAKVPTTFMRVLGFNDMTVSSTTEVTLQSRNVEVALVLDITGSMAGQRIIDLKDAANELIDIVVHDTQTPFYSKLGLVPYSIGVNVGGYATQIRGSYTNNTCTWPAAPTCRYYQFRRASDNNWTTQEISTCVTERTGANAYTDVPPSTTLVSPNYPAPGTYNPCPSSPIVPITSDKTLLHAQINALAEAGSTAGHIGIAWGWYLVSPNFGYLWPAANQPAAYGTEDLVKVVVIMTDGEFNTTYRNGVLAKDSTSGSGTNAYKINENATNGSSLDQALQLCTAMKSAGVIVYTVGFDIAGTGAQTVMQQCASKPEYAYEPADGAELKDVFRDIAKSISKLRLSK